MSEKVVKLGRLIKVIKIKINKIHLEIGKLISADEFRGKIYWLLVVLGELETINGKGYLMRPYSKKALIMMLEDKYEEISHYNYDRNKDYCNKDYDEGQCNILKYLLPLIRNLEVN